MMRKKMNKTSLAKWRHKAFSLPPNDEDENMEFLFANHIDGTASEGDVVHQIVHLATNGKKVKGNELDILIKSVEHKCPVLKTYIVERYPKISKDDYRLCIYVRCKLPPKVIANLLGISKSYVAIKRKRLLLKIFGMEGGASDFDRQIGHIGSKEHLNA